MNAINSGNYALQKLLSTPTGQKLFQECQQKGVKINFAEDNGDSSMGQFDPKTNTITVENGSLEQMIEVLAHEMLHASTPENGNSKQEELAAFLIGERAASEAGVNNNPQGADFYGAHIDKAYAGLQEDNGISNAISNMGLGANQIGNVGQNSFNTGNANIFAMSGTNGNNVFASTANPFSLGDNQQANGQQNQQNDPMMQMFQMMMNFFSVMMQMMPQVAGNNNQQQNNNNQASINPFMQQQQNFLTL